MVCKSYYSILIKLHVPCSCYKYAQYTCMLIVDIWPRLWIWIYKKKQPSNFLADGEYVEHAPGQTERHGEGTHYSRDGLVYSGKWENDKMNGEGMSNFILLTCSGYGITILLLL